MGASSSTPEYVAPPSRAHVQPNETRTLKQLGVELLHDTNVLKEHWVALVGVPVYVAHRELGACMAIAKKTRSLVSAGAHTYFVVRVVNPLFRPGSDEQLSPQHYIVPEQLVHRDGSVEQVLQPRELAVIEVRPYGAVPRTDIGAETSYSNSDGYVVVLSKLGVRTRLSWLEVRRLLTMQRDDARLALKIRTLARPDLVRTYEDVLAVKRALGELQIVCPQTAQFVNTHDTDEASWGSTLDAPRAQHVIPLPS